MPEAMSKMTATKQIFEPAGDVISALHQRRLATFEALQKAAKA